MNSISKPLPTAEAETGLTVIRALLRERSLLTALTITHDAVGNAFQITLPRFQPAVFSGPDSNRQILVSDRSKFSWRSAGDPVTRLLGKGVLVTDGEEHDYLRSIMNPTLQRKYVLPYVEAFWKRTDQIVSGWENGNQYDMLVEMRRIALLILFDTLFKVDLTPHLDRLWETILQLLEFIAPGSWIFWSGIPRPKYRKAIREMDRYLYGIIQTRRETLERYGNEIDGDDLLTLLVRNPRMSDELIRDQLLTILIAGHDTSTALLAWVLFLLGSHSHALAQAGLEAHQVFGNRQAPPDDDQLDKLEYLDQVIKETLRMYPPIHVGNRIAAEDTEIQGYRVPEGTRVMCSYYLSHHDELLWEEPERFKPERFNRRDPEKIPPLTYTPFGGGPRNCIGAAYSQIEAKVVLSRILQTFQLQLVEGQKIRPYMGATLEPRPGVKMRVWRRSS